MTNKKVMANYKGAGVLSRFSYCISGVYPGLNQHTGCK